MKIAFVSSNYHWESFSVLRSMYETLRDMAEVALFKETYRRPMAYAPDYIFLAGNDAAVIEGDGTPEIRFGLSDPNLFNNDKAQAVSLYCTNDYNTSLKGFYHFPIFCDPRYFEKQYVDKETDVLFIGLGEHPVVKDRVETVERLRESGFRIKVFGNGWPEYSDNHGFISGPELIDEINKARIMLDLSNETTALGSRILQASCCGVPVLTYRRPDIAKMFKENDEIYFYSNRAELSMRLSWANNENAKLSLTGDSARSRCLREHTVTKRLKDLFKYLGGRT